MTESYYGSAGHGPGAGDAGEGPGENASSEYINDLAIPPLIGGSGGGGGQGSMTQAGGRGGGGGGAILIVADGIVNIGGNIVATGGKGGEGFSSGGDGSGGAVRVAATTIAGSGGVYAEVVRFEAFNFDFTGVINADRKFPALPGVIASSSAEPSLRITTINGSPIPADPIGQSATPDVTFSSADPVAVQIEGKNIPPWAFVTVRAIPDSGHRVTKYTSLFGTLESSQGIVQITVPRGNGVLEAFAQYDVALPEPSSITVDGETVSSVLLQPTAKGGTKVLYVTKSGKMKPAPELK
ncbi:MAG: hypothetical protein ABIH23_03645 [bacterium]